MSDSPTSETWVNLTEATEISGYNREYVKKLVGKIWKKPEDEREIKIRKRSNGYEVWLPDFVTYTNDLGRGPRQRHQKNDSLD